jgi:hypothetical protein
MFPLTPPRSLAAALLLSCTAATQATTLLVTLETDSYDGVCDLYCSLRDAVAVANQAGGANTILLPAGTFVLSRPAALDIDGVAVDDDDHRIGDLDIVGELRIRGAGTAKSRIRGQFNDRLFEVRSGARLVLEDLTLEEGHSAQEGGAIKNRGQVLLREVLARNTLASARLEATGNGRRGRSGTITTPGELAMLASHLQDDMAADRGGASGPRDGNGGRVALCDSDAAEMPSS